MFSLINKKTVFLKIDPLHPEIKKVKVAAELIKSGEIVVFPTETVYGIGANAFNDVACKKIFEAKSRPVDNPLIVHVSSFDQAKDIGHVPAEYEDALRKVWPSPLTIIVKVKAKLSNSVTAGLKTVSLRVPAHPVALSLIKESGVPIAAPSANPSKKPSATNGLQAKRYFDGKVSCIIDSGDVFFGVESTIIDLTSFTLLRPGPFTVGEIENLFGKKPRITNVATGKSSTVHAISPGTKYRHYAPELPLFLFHNHISKLPFVLGEVEDPPDYVFIGCEESCERISSELGCSTVPIGSGKDLFSVAKGLYNGLILIDSLNVKFAIIEEFDETGIGFAIMNRIRKASSNLVFSNIHGLEKLLKANKLASYEEKPPSDN